MFNNFNKFNTFTTIAKFANFSRSSHDEHGQDARTLHRATPQPGCCTSLAWAENWGH